MIISVLRAELAGTSQNERKHCARPVRQYQIRGRNTHVKGKTRQSVLVLYERMWMMLYLLIYSQHNYTGRTLVADFFIKETRSRS